MRRFERFVAIGDSTVEGLDDPDGQGGYRGWANRLAERLARQQGGLEYANLAVRGRKTREVLDEQLGPALDLRPDLVALVSGTNDILRPRFDAEAVARDIERMQRAFVEAGATVVSFSLPDLTPVLPLARPLRARIRQFARALVEASARSGALVIDFTAYPVASDPRLWSEDRLHANAAGHARIAEALAHALSLPGAGSEWAEALPERERPGVAAIVAAELRWTRRYFLPWLGRHARGRSSGEGCQPKQPQLEAVVPAGDSGGAGLLRREPNGPPPRNDERSNRLIVGSHYRVFFLSSSRGAVTIGSFSSRHCEEPFRWYRDEATPSPQLSGLRLPTKNGHPPFDESLR